MSGFRPRIGGRVWREARSGQQLWLGLAVLVCLLCEGGRAATLPSDVEALAAIKAQLDPSTVRVGSCLESWNFTQDPCQPASPLAFVCGLRCSLQGAQFRVTSLTLSGSGYKGTLSEYVGNLSALQSADFSQNSLGGTIPHRLGKLKQLTRLDLSSNLFSGGVPASLGALTSLEYLSVSNNLLRGPIPATLTNLHNATALLLSRNQLTGRLPAGLAALRRLLRLDASHNLLTGRLPTFPPQLVRLVLRGNRLTGRLPRSLRRLRALTVLDVSGNALGGALGAAVLGLPALQQLNVSGNALTALRLPRVPLAGSAALASQLVALDASGNRILGPLPPALAGFPALSGLALSRNLLSGRIPDAYARKAAGSVPGVAPLSLLLLDGNYLDGTVPPAFLSLPPDSVLTASFLGNCLQSCPAEQPFCQGGAQRSRPECDAFQKHMGRH